MPQAPGSPRGARRRAKRLRQPLFRRRRGLRGGLLTITRRILGVDPGTRCSGWAVLAGTPHKPELIACGEIRLSERLELAARLASLHARLLAVVDEHLPSEAAVEAPFHGVSARSALQLAHARGAVLATLGTAAVRVFEYAPATIKKAVTGNGRAEKDQVGAMIGRLVPGTERKLSPDIADAIAAALCHLCAKAHADAIARVGSARSRR